MCQKYKKIWQCGHSNTEDPRRCRHAANRNKPSCQAYGFAWAFRDPVVEKREGECCDCKRARHERERQEANQKFVELSRAYPQLKDVSVQDDETRQKVGRPRYGRSISTSEKIVIPDGWTPAQNRLPSNANEYEQFVRGRFNPLQELPDSHVPPQLPGPMLYGGPRPLPAPATTPPQALFQPQPRAFTNKTHIHLQGYRSRPPPPGFAPQMPRDARIARYVIFKHKHAQITPPHHESSAVVLEDVECPYVEFLALNCAPPQQIPDHRRRPSYTSSNDSRGWVPPMTSPLPPHRQIDTAPVL